MRLFLAIELPKKVKRELYNQLELLIKKYPQFNWVSEENFHVTIHFFGERNDVKEIKNKIKDILWDQEGFYLYSFGLDIFVNHKLVIYLNFQRQKKIEELARVVKENFDKNSINTRRFIPHLTLGRGLRSSKQQYFALQKKLAKINIDISFHVKKIVLYQSILTSIKPVYKKLASFSLN